MEVRGYEEFRPHFRVIIAKGYSKLYITVGFYNTVPVDRTWVLLQNTLPGYSTGIHTGIHIFYKNIIDKKYFLAFEILHKINFKSIF